MISQDSFLGKLNKDTKEKLSDAKANPWVGLVDDIDPGFLKALDGIVSPAPSPTDTKLTQAKNTAVQLKNGYDFIKKAYDLYTQASSREDLLFGMLGTAGERVLTLGTDSLFRGQGRLSSVMNGVFMNPAATLGSMFVGGPHMHSHPPPVPPAPMIAVGPILTGCPTVLIGGKPAATTGDIGLAIWCGSTAPFFQIYTGSHKVKIGGKRAARQYDIVKYCQKAPPAKPGDPPAPKTVKEAFMATSKEKLMGLVTKKVEPTDKWLTTAKKRVGTPLSTFFEQGKKIYEHNKAEAELQKAREDAADKRIAAEGKSGAELDAALVDVQAAECAVEAQEAAHDAQNGALAVAAAAATLGMDVLREALGKLLGTDPGTPPPLGIIAYGLTPSKGPVLIGGFPMPETADLIGGAGKGGIRGMLAAKREAASKKAARAKKLAEFKETRADMAAARGSKTTSMDDARAAVQAMKRKEVLEKYKEKADEKSAFVLPIKADKIAAVKEMREQREKAEAGRETERQKKREDRRAAVQAEREAIAKKKGVTPDQVSNKEAYEATKAREAEVKKYEEKRAGNKVDDTARRLTKRPNQAVPKVKG